LSSVSDGEGRTEKIRICLITGDPGIGKTTMVSKVIFWAKSAGFTIGGILTREVRSHGERLGFNLMDVSSEETSSLASSAPGSIGPRVGKYRVNLRTLSTLVPKAMQSARENSDIIVCDEIGPMELFSPEFRRTVGEAVVNSRKASLCVIHKRLSDPLIEELRSNPESKVFEVTLENRDNLPQEIWTEMIQYLKNGK
jgi:nucleoside-triphosphatase